MKRYIVTDTRTKDVVGSFKTKAEAQAEIIKMLQTIEDCLSIFDLKIEEAEDGEIASIEDAVEFLAKELNITEEELLIFKANELRAQTTVTNTLIIIAEAWNKQDGFTPDLSDKDQLKHVPLFKFNPDTRRMEYNHTFCWKFGYTSLDARVCFATQERAAQFGRRFEDLYNEILLPTINQNQ